MAELSKNEAISKIYYDVEDGFSSINATFKEAKKYNKELTLDDVRNWFDKHVGRKKQLSGYNSFVANYAYQEFQMDLFFFEDLNKESKEKQPNALLMIDIFTKYVEVVPVNTKQPNDILNGIKELINLMNGKPETIYSDEEGSFVSKVVQKYFKDENIRHLVTRGHASFAERAIRTLKDLIYRRVEALNDPFWQHHIKNVLNQYNNKNVHRSTKFTPKDARLAKNYQKVKMNLESLRKTNRKYPNINVDDNVRIYKKKDKYDKERIGVWSKDSYKVEEIIESDGQKLYKTSAREKPFMRSELLLIS
mgnify:FL=1